MGNTIRVTNHTNQPIIIPTDAHMLRVRPTYDSAKDSHNHEDDHAAAYVTYVRLYEYDAIADVTKDVRIDPSLTKKQKEKLISIHKKFGNLFDGDLREVTKQHNPQKYPCSIIESSFIVALLLKFRKYSMNCYRLRKLL